MEQRPSDSQNESANELPQSVPQPSPVAPTATDESAVTQRSDDTETSAPGTVNPPKQERGSSNRQFSERNPQGQDRQNQPGTDKPRQDRPNRDNQPRSNQSGQPANQSPKQNQQPRQQNQQPSRDPNQSPKGQGGQANGQEKQRDPNQQTKQNQSGNERAGQEKPSQERQQRGNQQPRDAKPARDSESDGREEDSRKTDLRSLDKTPTGPREATVRESDDRLTIGITLGDYNGIGPEVILKALQYNRLQKICTPIIYGSMRVLNRYRNLLDMKDWNLNGIQQVEQASHKLTNVLTCWPDQNQEIQPGKVTAEAGQAAFACLQRAVEDLRDGKLDAIVTAPINKYNIQSEDFKFPGHTEYLAEAFSVADNLMFLVSERLRVGVVTGHVPLGRVRQNITRERILQKITMMSQSLRLDFGIDKPRIAVLGLNPHAGEEGLLGNEEQEIVKPLIKQLQDKGNLVFGPFPADGFFGMRSYLKFDAVLAMYHDQGLIPFKAIAFEEGVNFTAGMPVVRTSPDHGTAYDIAGKNTADETSMLQAIYTACDIARRRRESAEIDAGALKPKRERAV